MYVYICIYYLYIYICIYVYVYLYIYHGWVPGILYSIHLMWCVCWMCVVTFSKLPGYVATAKHSGSERRISDPKNDIMEMNYDDGGLLLPYISGFHSTIAQSRKLLPQWNLFVFGELKTIMWRLRGSCTEIDMYWPSIMLCVIEIHCSTVSCLF